MNLSKEAGALKSFKNLMKGNIWTLIWTRMILFFVQKMYREYFPFYIQILGGSSETIGFVYSMSTIASLIIVPVTGYLADYIGRVKIIFSAFYFRSVTFLIYLFSTNWVSLAIGNFYQGLSEYYHAAQSAIMADSLPPGHRATGFAALYSMPQIVSIVGPSVGAFIITAYGIELGMRYVFFVVFVGMILVAIGRQVGLTETLTQTKSLTEFKAIHGGIKSIIRESYRSSWEALRWTPKSLVVFVLIESLSSFAGAMVGPFWPVYAKEIINLSIVEWGLVITFTGFLHMLLSIPAGMIIDKIGNKKTIIMMLFLSLFNGILFLRCNTFVQTLTVMLYITAIGAFMAPACYAFIADTVPREIRARITSAYGRGSIGIIGGVGGAGAGYVIAIPTLLGSIAGGFIYGFNPTYPWLIQAAALLICLILSILFLQEPKTPEV